MKLKIFLLLPLSFLAIACSNDQQPGEIAEQSNKSDSVLDLCATAFQNQIPAFDFTSKSKDKLNFASSIGIGYLKDGYCLDTATEFYPESKDSSAYIILEVKGVGDDSGIMFTEKIPLETEGLTPLLLPDLKCFVFEGTAFLKDGEISQNWSVKGKAGKKCVSSALQKS